MISQEIYDRMMRVATLNRFTSYDAKEMENLIKQTFNSSYVVCTHCPQQIKHGQKLILNFLENVEINSEEILFPSTPEVEVDIVEADKVGCTKCSRKKKIKS
jgi:hypothetical protein